MPTTVVRYTVKPEHADENAALIEKVMAELAESRPAGLAYQVFRLPDGTFVHLAEVSTPSNPLLDRVQTSPVALPATLVGAYA